MPGCRREDPDGPAAVGLFCETTLAPKKRRISASLSRCGSDTDSRVESVYFDDVEAAGPFEAPVDGLCRSGYLVTGDYRRRSRNEK